MKTALLALACVALGLGLGRMMARPAPVIAGAPAASPAAAASAEAAPGISRAELAAIVRSELARERGERGERSERSASVVAENPESSDEAAAVETRPEVLERGERARTTVTTAVARGSWTEADKGALIVELDGLPAKMQEEITGRLAAAINQGRIRIDMDGLPL